MGYQQIRAECECGYKAEKIEFGCTMIMLEVKKIDYMPAYCNTCGELIGVNILAKPPICSKGHSDDVKIYGEPEMTGNIIEPDLTSERFFRGFELWNETYEMLAKDNNENFVPLTIDEYREDVIARRQNI